MQIETLSPQAGEAAGIAIRATYPNLALIRRFLPRHQTEHADSIDAHSGRPAVRQLAVQRSALVHAGDICTDPGRCP